MVRPRTRRASPTSAIEKRKNDHIDLCRSPDVEFRRKTTLLEDVWLTHQALPELDYDQLDLSTELCGKTLRAPIVIASMTGGMGRGKTLNRALAAFAEKRGYGFGLGSQRPMLENEARTASFCVRDVAPTTLVFGNLGVLQARDLGVAKGRALCERVGADAMFLHLNPAQEMFQQDGDRDFRGAEATLATWIRELGLPVVPKETGAGVARSLAERLKHIGATYVDVGGAGGTSWVGVEALRADKKSESRLVGETFWDWGVPTAVSVVHTARAGLHPLATGGIRNGLDAARALALGACAVGVARPALVAYFEGKERALHQYFDRFERELRTAMLLTGAGNLAALTKVEKSLGPQLQTWLRA